MRRAAPPPSPCPSSAPERWSAPRRQRSGAGGRGGGALVHAPAEIAAHAEPSRGACACCWYWREPRSSWFRLIETAYGPRYSNAPMSEERPGYSKLILGSVSLSVVDRRTSAVALFAV